MNRKNPGLAETESMGREEQRLFQRCCTIGATIAAVLYTIYAVCRRDAHHGSTAAFGWLMAAWTWGVFWYERRKEKRPSER